VDHGCSTLTDGPEERSTLHRSNSILHFYLPISFSPDATVEIYNRFGATVHENFGGIQTDVVKNQYKKIFPEFFPRIKIH
jgi:hypothetical protein